MRDAGKNDEKGQGQKGYGTDAGADERGRYARDTPFRPLKRNFKNQKNTRTMIKLPVVHTYKVM